MSLLVPWLVFPLALGALCLGCGALVARLAGLRAGPELLLPLGYAAIVVAAGFLTWIPGTARLALPVVVGLAAAGLAASWRPQRVSRSSVAALVAAGCVFLAYGLPVLASGEASFTGYISLDDTATWLALTDRTLEEGRSLDGLAAVELRGHPRVVPRRRLPGRRLPAARDRRRSSWARTSPGCSSRTIAFLAALLALALYALARTLVRSALGRSLRRLRRGSAGAALRLRPVERREGGRRGLPRRVLLRAGCREGRSRSRVVRSRSRLPRPHSPGL